MLRRFPLSLAVFTLLLPHAAEAQSVERRSTPVEGLRDGTPAVHAFTNARIVAAPDRVLERATLVVRDGVVEAVGAGAAVPADARVRDMEGRTLYPGFLDAYAHVGMLEEVSDPGEQEPRGPIHWSPQMRAFQDAAADFRPDEGRASELRSQGFTVAHTVPRLGLFRGATAAVSLGDGRASEVILRPGIAQAATLWRDPSLGFGYPTSAMGAIVFIRQALLDADWYERAHAAWARDPEGLARPETNRGLGALAAAARGEQPLLFETRDEDDFMRAVRFGEESPVSLWIRGSGYEYRIAGRVETAGIPLILPVAFPEAPRVERPAEALRVSLEELRHWHRAPENPGRLAAAGIRFSLTAHGLDDPADFLPNVRKAVSRGLDRQEALAALTTRPAGLLGLERTHGSLERGKAANLVVADGDLFDEGTRILEVWVDGRRYEVDPPPSVDPRGRWRLVATGAGPLDGELILEGRPGSLSGSFAARGEEVPLRSASLAQASRRLDVAFPGDAFGLDGVVRLSGSVSGERVHGFGDLPDGERLAWRAERIRPATDDGQAASARSPAPEENGPNGRSGGNGDGAGAAVFDDLGPVLEYGRTSPPEQPEHLLVTNAVVWTMGPDGILEDADLLVTRGRVARVGRGLEAPAGASVVDAGGRHVTPGLIDAHLHSGVSGGVNEVGSAIVPEVRIGDVLTANDIWMYRQLAGGLTTAHVKHGSANPIGGQNAFVKLRWGGLPDEIRLEGAPRTVKFALGCVVRGATPHFDHVAGQAASGSAAVARETGVPVAFGVLTTDTWEQAVERSGGKLGNKGAEAALTAVETARLLQAL